MPPQGQLQSGPVAYMHRASQTKPDGKRRTGAVGAGARGFSGA
jgi:hypothetical protein